MQILSFDQPPGFYRFAMSELSTGMHQHPAPEVIYAPHADLTLVTPDHRHEGVSLTIIPRNTPHQVVGGPEPLHLWVIEHRDRALMDAFDLDPSRSEPWVKQGQDMPLEEVERRLKAVAEGRPQPAQDARVARCLEALTNTGQSYPELMEALPQLVHLSQSRLSHLFKAEVGCSIKRYQVWCRLKRTIEIVLRDEESLFSAGLLAGFYDQAHLSKAFKELMGVSPSQAYNSGTVQL